MNWNKALDKALTEFMATMIFTQVDYKVTCDVCEEDNKLAYVVIHDGDDSARTKFYDASSLEDVLIFILGAVDKYKETHVVDNDMLMSIWIWQVIAKETQDMDVYTVASFAESLIDTVMDGVM